MPVNLRGRCLLSLPDFEEEEILYLLDLSASLKAEKLTGRRGDRLEGRNIVMIFDKPSTRTRCAFETAIANEGGHSTLLTNSQMGAKESIEDSAKVLGRYYDAILYRTDRHSNLELFAEHSGVPVWNGLSDVFHPTQALADFLTIREKTCGRLRNLKLCFVGDARNNMAHSLMLGCAKLGMHYSVAAPRELFPDEELFSMAGELARQSGGSLQMEQDVETAVRDADIIYTDVWASMGEESHFARRIALLRHYQVNERMMEQTGNNECLFMHCLPAFHNTETEIGRRIHAEYGLEAMEVTDQVFHSRQSVVFDQAENRMHTARALAVATCGNV